MRRFRRLLVLATALVVGVGVLLPTQQPAVAGPSVFNFFGGGFGHGVGMSQFGAQGMAARGVGYADILRHYYQGTAVQSQAQPFTLRIHLADDGSAQPGTTMTAGGNVQVFVGGAAVASATNGQQVRVTLVNGQWMVSIAGQPATGPFGGSGTSLFMSFSGDDPNHSGAVGPIRVDKTGRRYLHGRLELMPIGNVLRIVLVDITMQRYLYGLGEVPSSWPTEALRAQAIAARTYAKDKDNRLGQRRSNCSCGLFATVSDQNYVGYDKEVEGSAANWLAAVNDTNNQTVTYQGTAIQAFYSSSSGGHTENSENVFVEALPYLRGVPDGDDRLNNPNFTWSRSYTREQLQTWLNAASDTAVGTLDNIELLGPFGVSGRVIKVADANNGGVRITGSSGTKRVSGDRLRQVINAGVGGGLANQMLSTLYRLGGFDAYGSAFTGGVYIGAGRTDTSGQDRVVTGAGQGGGPHVRIFNAEGQVVNNGWFAYTPGFSGGVRVAVCNLNGDGAPDEIVTAPGPGGGPHVRIFNGNGGDLGGFMAYNPAFTGGVYVGCGDVDNDGKDEIITGPGAGGGPHVRVFRANGAVAGEFMAYAPAFTGGVRVGAADIEGPDAPAVIITGAGPGGGPHVRLLTLAGAPRYQFFAYSTAFTGGVYVAGGDETGDGAEEIITGAGETGGPHVRILGADGTDRRPGFFAFNTGNDRGARVASGFFPAAGVVAGAGTGSRPLVRVFTF